MCNKNNGTNAPASETIKQRINLYAGNVEQYNVVSSGVLRECNKPDL